MSHPSDSRMNAVNQRFWLCYHSLEDLMGPCSSCDTHLIRPTNTSKAGEVLLGSRVWRGCHWGGELVLVSA